MPPSMARFFQSMPLLSEHLLPLYEVSPIVSSSDVDELLVVSSESESKDSEDEVSWRRRRFLFFLGFFPRLSTSASAAISWRVRELVVDCCPVAAAVRGGAPRAFVG